MSVGWRCLVSAVIWLCGLVQECLDILLSTLQMLGKLFPFVQFYN